MAEFSDSQEGLTPRSHKNVASLNPLIRMTRKCSVHVNFSYSENPYTGNWYAGYD